MLQEIPLPLIGRLGDVSGHTPEGSLLLLVMEYGENFSGPGKDPFRADRAAGDVLEAHRSNFLHPVLYYYKTSPDGKLEYTINHLAYILLFPKHKLKIVWIEVFRDAKLIIDLKEKIVRNGNIIVI